MTQEFTATLEPGIPIPVVVNGSPQTPWASDIDAAGFALNNTPAIHGPAQSSLELNASNQAFLNGDYGAYIQTGSPDFGSMRSTRLMVDRNGTVTVNPPDAAANNNALSVDGDLTVFGVIRPLGGISGGGGGSQTPWTSDIDAAGFSLNNCGVVNVATPSGGGMATISLAGNRGFIQYYEAAAQMYVNNGLGPLELRGASVVLYPTPNGLNVITGAARTSRLTVDDTGHVTIYAADDGGYALGVNGPVSMGVQETDGPPNGPVNGSMTVTFSPSQTALVFHHRASDGTLRTATVPLA